MPWTEHNACDPEDDAATRMTSSPGGPRTKPVLVKTLTRNQRGEEEVEGKSEGEMVVRIRLSRLGCRNKPFYRLMAADSRSPRDGKHLEVVGYYNPLPGKDGGKRMGLNFDRVKYWLSVGAQPSEPVQRLLFRAGLLPPPPMLAMAQKGGPRDTRPMDPMTGKFLTQGSLGAFSGGAESGDDQSDDEAKL